MRAISFSLKYILRYYFWPLMGLTALMAMWCLVGLILVMSVSSVPHLPFKAAVVVDKGLPTSVRDDLNRYMDQNSMILSVSQEKDSEDILKLKMEAEQLSQEKPVWPDILTIELIPISSDVVSRTLNTLKSQQGVSDVYWDDEQLKFISSQQVQILGLISVILLLWICFGVAGYIGVAILFYRAVCESIDSLQQIGTDKIYVHAHIRNMMLIQLMFFIVLFGLIAFFYVSSPWSSLSDWNAFSKA